MNWYYLNGDKAVGPLAGGTMTELRACGMLTDDTQVAIEGTEEWSAYADAFKDTVKLPPVPPRAKGPSLAGNTWSKVADGMSSAAGLERLEGHGAKNLFGALFLKRTIEEMEDSFAVGSGNTTPHLKDASPEWPAPWVFMRLLSFSIVVTIGFYWALLCDDN